MGMKRKASGSMVDITVRKRRSGGVWVDVAAVKRRVGGAWVDVWPLNLNVSPTTANGFHVNSPASNIPANRTVTTGTVTASGGTTYTWAYLSGDSSITANTANSASTSFSASIPIGGSKSAVFRVTSGSLTADVPVNLSYDSGF